MRPVTKSPLFCRTQKFVALLTTARHWSLSRTRFNQFRSSYPIILGSNLILFSHLRPRLSSVSSPQVFLPNSYINLSFLPRMPHSPPIFSSSVGSRNDTRCTAQIMNLLLLLVMRSITTFRPTTERTYDGGPIIL